MHFEEKLPKNMAWLYQHPHHGIIISGASTFAFVPSVAQLQLMLIAAGVHLMTLRTPDDVVCLVSDAAAHRLEKFLEGSYDFERQATPVPWFQSDGSLVVVYEGTHHLHLPDFALRDLVVAWRQSQVPLSVEYIMNQMIRSADNTEHKLQKQAA